MTSSLAPLEKIQNWCEERETSRVFLLLAVLVTLVYAGMPAEEFTFDNAFIVGADTRLQSFSWESVRLIFTRDYWWPTMASNLYRPFTTLSFLFEYSFLGFGKAALGYQISNALLHLLCALLLFKLGRRSGLGIRWALFAATVYAVHPVATEVVANIVGRSDLLATAATLGGLLFWSRYRELLNGAKARRCLFGVGVCGLAGVLAKESAIVLPALIGLKLITESCFDAAGPWRGLLKAVGSRRNWALALVFFPGVAVFLIGRVYFSAQTGVTDHPFVDNPMMAQDFLPSRLTAIGVWGMQLWTYVLPATISSDYSFDAIPVAAWPLGNSTAWWGWGTAGVFALAGGALLVTWRRLPGLTFMALAYVLCMLPTANVLIRIGSIRADRFHYMPSAFLILGVALMAQRFLMGCASSAAGRRFKLERPMGILVGAWLLAITALSHFRCYDWRSNLTLWTSAYAVSPGSVKAVGGFSNERARVLANADAAWEAVGRLEAYLSDLRARADEPPRKWAIMLYSDLTAYYLNIYDDMLEKRRPQAELDAVLARAFISADEGLRLDEENRVAWEAKWRHVDQPTVIQNEILHRNYAIALHRARRYEEAEQVLRHCADSAGFKLAPRIALYELYISAGRKADAIEAWMLVCLIEPNYKDSILRIGELICELHPGSHPIKSDEKGQPSLSINDQSVLIHLKPAVLTYKALLEKAELKLQAARLVRVARIQYGLKIDN
jgi:tetratricopeptide (TPR) repeat protein